MSTEDLPDAGSRGPGSDPGEVARLRGDLARQQRLLAAIPDFVSVVGRDFVYREVNRAYLDAYLKRRKEIVGHTVAELLGQERFESISRPRLERCFRGEPTQHQAWFELPQGGRRFMNVSYSPCLEPDGSISGAVVSARDITDPIPSPPRVHSTGRVRSSFPAARCGSEPGSSPSRGTRRASSRP